MQSDIHRIQENQFFCAFFQVKCFFFFVKTYKYKLTTLSP